MKKSLVLGGSIGCCLYVLHLDRGTATAVAGQQVQMSLSLSGDGVTEGADIDLAFDEARPTLPVTGESMPCRQQD